MTRRSWLAAAFVAGAISSCGAESREPSNVVAVDAWAPATVDDATRGFVFVTVTADNDDELVDASVNGSVARLTSVFSGLAADSVGGHLGHLDGDGAPDHEHGDPSRIPLTKNQPVELRPGEGRIILDELSQPLIEGETFTVTLNFASGAAVVTTVTVRA